MAVESTDRLSTKVPPALLEAVVRRFLPRESPPEALARPHLRRLADRLNDTPRRCLDYRTPREAFQQHLAAPAGPP